LTIGYLLKFGWFKIERHTLVKGRSSPDDPQLREYWKGREKAKANNISPRKRRLVKNQGYVCPLCGVSLFNDEELHIHHRRPKAKGGTDEVENLLLVHLYCHQQIHRKNGKSNFVMA
jgi:RNA-directed DNA polymerase